MAALSARLREVVDALPLTEAMRVIEIGCGPGAAAREVAHRIGPAGRVLAVDRSPRATAQAVRTCGDLIRSGRVRVATCAVEDLALDPDEDPYDLAFAIRVGAFDGRHPSRFDQALRSVAAALVPGGRMFIDGGEPLKELRLPTA